MSKTTVIHHSADFDGLFCREIARKFLPGAELIGWDYKDAKIPFPTEGKVYVLDLSPDCFDTSYTDESNARLVWIDHHKTAIDKFWSGIPGYRIDGVAACRLAWQFFTGFQNSFGNDEPHKTDFVERRVSEPTAVRLAGEYDIWDKRDPNAEVFQFALRSRELTQGDWNDLLSSKVIGEGTGMDISEGDLTVSTLLQQGHSLQQYQQRNDAGTMGRSFLVNFSGLKFLTLNTARCNSLTFAAKDIPETGHDALMGFCFDGEKWNVSMYHAKHRLDLDLSAIAKSFGGGGHRGACGFRTDFPSFIAK